MKLNNMNGISPELADILISREDYFLSLGNLCSVQHKAIRDICSCRTSRLGAHCEQCNQCGHNRISYNSCRNRNCPKCQQSKQMVWLDKLKAYIIPVKHFQFVFTIPEALKPLFYINQNICYSLLFKAANEALKKSIKSYLCAESGSIAILHTWGQTLNYHPHIHMMIPAGGIDVDGMQWIHSDGKYLVPVQAVSALFRGILTKMLEKQWNSNNLKIPQKTDNNFVNFKRLMYSKKWNVFAEKPLKGPVQLINYLGKYVNRVAISNHRIIEWKDGKVTFLYNNNNSGVRNCRMILNEIDFINRFLWHVLPNGFYKIRYYGIYAQINSEIKEHCFDLLGEQPFFPSFQSLPLTEVARFVTGVDMSYCPVCKKGRMIRVKNCSLSL